MSVQVAQTEGTGGSTQYSTVQSTVHMVQLEHAARSAASKRAGQGRKEDERGERAGVQCGEIWTLCDHQHAAIDVSHDRIGTYPLSDAAPAARLVHIPYQHEPWTDINTCLLYTTQA